MKRDPLKQYVSLRESLLKRKATLEAELAKINTALGEASPVAAPAAKVKAATGGRKRAKNSVSLKAAVSQALAEKSPDQARDPQGGRQARLRLHGQGPDQFPEHAAVFGQGLQESR
jgi:dsDNA-specific endonuclease/ATPase MutS2